MPGNATHHSIVVDDASEVDLPAESIDLVVTSPPYPMIEMWDELFAELDPAIGTALAADNGMEAFELMHDQLDTVWKEVAGAVVEGGLVCVNIGDATRSIDGSFQVFPNIAQVIETFRGLGFHVLPRIYWKKPTNSTTAFLGSGTLPPNAYPKLEHEHILVFRKGDSRSFEPKADRRYESAYFFEERNQWFSDQWDSVRGTSQEFEDIGGGELRDRSGAFPLELPYRLINMFSVYGDVVCDPFVGTGTTTLAAMLAGRNSLGVEIDGEVAGVLERRVQGISAESKQLIADRIGDHQEYLQSRREDGDPASYSATNYPFKVVTKREKDIQFYQIVECRSVDAQSNFDVEFVNEGGSSIVYEVEYTPYDGEIPVFLSEYS